MISMYAVKGLKYATKKCFQAKKAERTLIYFESLESMTKDRDRLPEKIS